MDPIALLHLLIFILIVGVIFWLVLYLVDASPVPEPFKSVLRWVVIAFGVLWLIYLLLGLLGDPGLGLQLWPRRPLTH
jgi:hypothetical protein